MAVVLVVVCAQPFTAKHCVIRPVMGLTKVSALTPVTTSTEDEDDAVVVEEEEGVVDTAYASLGTAVVHKSAVR